MTSHMTEVMRQQLQDSIDELIRSCDRATVHTLPDKSDQAARFDAERARLRGVLGPQVDWTSLATGASACSFAPEVDRATDVYVAFWRAGTFLYWTGDYEVRPGGSLRLDGLGLSV